MAVDLFEFRALLKTLVLPPSNLIVLALFGLVLGRTRRFRSAGKMLSACAVVFLWLLATPVVANQLMKVVRENEALSPSDPIVADAIVILAGGVRRYAPEYNEDAPNEVTLQRIAYGARLAHKSGLPVLVAGGRGEATVMRRFLETDFDVSPRWVEEASQSTRENALFSAPILKAQGVRSIVLVTSALHMPRAVSEFEGQGLEVTAAPVTQYSPREGFIARWVPGISGLRDSRDVFYELLARLEYRLRW